MALYKRDTKVLLAIPVSELELVCAFRVDSQRFNKDPTDSESITKREDDELESEFPLPAL